MDTHFTKRDGKQLVSVTHDLGPNVGVVGCTCQMEDGAGAADFEQAIESARVEVATACAIWFGYDAQWPCPSLPISEFDRPGLATSRAEIARLVQKLT